MPEIISREDAIKQGSTRYFSGRPCKRGHMAERYVKTSGCIQCSNDNSKLFKEENPEYSKVNSKTWYEDNQEKVKLNRLRLQEIARKNAEEFRSLQPQMSFLVCEDVKLSTGLDSNSVVDLLESLPKNRAEADRVGAIHFFTGRPCHAGHISARYTKGGQCIECVFTKRGKLGIVRPRSARNMEKTKQAIASGKTTYTSVSPCPKGHFEKFVATNHCVECQKEAGQAGKTKSKHTRLKSIYGLDEESYNHLIETQEGKCKICGFYEPEKFKLHVDHCHDTNKVRGLLCGKCNQAIGLLKHSVPLMLCAISYLEEGKENDSET